MTVTKHRRLTIRDEVILQEVGFPSSVRGALSISSTEVSLSRGVAQIPPLKTDRDIELKRDQLLDPLMEEDDLSS